MLQIMRYSEAEMGCLRCYVCSSVLSGNQWEPGNATITDYTLDSVAPLLEKYYSATPAS